MSIHHQASILSGRSWLPLASLEAKGRELLARDLAAPVSVCVSVYVRVCMCVYLRAYVYVLMHIRLYIYMCDCVHLCGSGVFTPGQHG